MIPSYLQQHQRLLTALYATSEEAQTAWTGEELNAKIVRLALLTSSMYEARYMQRRELTVMATMRQHIKLLG